MASDGTRLFISYFFSFKPPMSDVVQYDMHQVMRIKGGVVTQQLASLVLLIIGSIAAALAALRIKAVRADTHGCALPVINGIAGGPQESASIDRPPAPYEGVARRKPAPGLATYSYPSAVLRSKP
jgi:hypothetical protein